MDDRNVFSNVVVKLKRDGMSWKCSIEEQQFWNTNSSGNSTDQITDENNFTDYETEAETTDTGDCEKGAEQTLHSCMVCKKRFETKWGLRYHMRKHIGTKPYPCHLCEKRFSSIHGLSNHENTHTGIHRCSECGKFCQSTRDLAVHKRRHFREKLFECSVCNKRFNTLLHLVNHKSTHSAEKPYECNLCHKEFSVPGHLNRHMRVHAENERNKCPSYDESNEQDTQPKKTYGCPFCPRRLKSNSGMHAHIRLHTGAKPFSCRHCSERFTYRKQFQRHLFDSHGEGRQYPCNICQKRFNSHSELRLHVRRHEGVKPYGCSECPKRFCSASDLCLHQLVHSDVRRYHCSSCAKSFKYKRSVVVHFRKCAKRANSQEPWK